ncbi:hypothetical protein [Serratia proteamaculans]|nr:hypothetical protein [Serratia proteamaculans]
MLWSGFDLVLGYLLCVPSVAAAEVLDARLYLPAYTVVPLVPSCP